MSKAKAISLLKNQIMSLECFLNEYSDTNETDIIAEAKIEAYLHAIEIIENEVE